MPPAARIEPRGRRCSHVTAATPILVDATISGLRGIGGRRARPRAAGERPAAGQADAVTMLAAAVAKSADVAGGAASDRARRRRRRCRAWQRSALLLGLDTGLPSAGGGRRRARRRAAAAPPARLVSLPAEPAELTRLAATDRRDAAPWRSGSSPKLEWPGKPAPVVAAASRSRRSSSADTMPDPRSTRASASAATSRTARARKRLRQACWSRAT